MKKESYIFLTGGLGNQLFQLAFLMTRDTDIKIAEVNLGRPRINSMSLPDVSDFDFSSSINFKSLMNHSTITRKLVGYLLRAGLESYSSVWVQLFNSCIQHIANLIISMKLSRKLKTVYSKDNGFNLIPESKGSEYLIGYFQSYRWLEERNKIKDFFQNLKLKKPSDDFINFLSLHGEKKSLAVHVRLGDYLQDPTLGVLGAEYYELAITQIMGNDRYDEIWLFSNEPEKAILYIPNCYMQLVRVIPDFSGSSAETLEAMRHASAYVIANSSLSWWGAKLSYSRNPKVIAPKPWFTGKPDPRDLIPGEWKQIERHIQQNQ